MIQPRIQNQWTLEVSQKHFLAIAIESFLIDRKPVGPTKSTVEFYTYNLQ